VSDLGAENYVGTTSHDTVTLRKNTSGVSATWCEGVGEHRAAHLPWCLDQSSHLHQNSEHCENINSNKVLVKTNLVE